MGTKPIFFISLKLLHKVNYEFMLEADNKIIIFQFFYFVYEIIPIVLLFTL